jgi:surfactin synthase thioesterase subunit
MTVNLRGLVCWEPRPTAKVSLICVPWACSGAAPFFSWVPMMPLDVELWAVRRRGREVRLAEPPYDDMASVVAELADDVARLPRRPYVLFGHCLGGLVAYELLQELRRRGRPDPMRLVVTGEAPATRTVRRELGDLRDELVEIGLTDARITDNPRMFELLRPAMEADLRIGREYVRGDDPPLDLPVVVVMATADRAEEPAFRAWDRDTTGPTELAVVQGEHLYPDGAWDALAKVVIDNLHHEVDR